MEPAQEPAPLYQWDAPEYIRNERTVDWYWAVALLGLSGVVACVYFGNALFGVIVLIGTILIIAYASKPVPKHAIQIDNRAITISGVAIRWDHVSAFWIEMHPHEGPKLILKSDTQYMSTRVIPIDTSISIPELRSFLETKSTETELSEPILVRLLEFIF
jgi:hypothetical protein